MSDEYHPYSLLVMLYFFSKALKVLCCWLGQPVCTWQQVDMSPDPYWLARDGRISKGGLVAAIVYEREYCTASGYPFEA
jgi:hypothetical protein